MDNKLCRTCGETKSPDEYYKDRSKLSGRSSQCILCEKEHKKRSDVRARANLLNRQKYQNPETRKRILARNKRWREENHELKLEMDRRWRANNRERHRAYSRKWVQDNPERSRAYQKEYYLDMHHHLARSLRIRMNQAVNNNQKAGSVVADLGCSISAFKLYIENQFEDEMTWNNYGKWHLDHVLPLASFDLTDRQQFLEAANWLNYQPLWAEDNLTKGSKVT